jgi:glycosyltransferase involved in cell wall biosynthesis
MSYGAPVITSKTSSLPEAAGEAGILVDPNNIFQLTQAMNNVLSDSSLRNRMIKLGKDQAQKFSWVETAQQIYNIIRDVKGDNE